MKTVTSTQSSFRQWKVIVVADAAVSTSSSSSSCTSKLPNIVLSKSVISVFQLGSENSQWMRECIFVCEPTPSSSSSFDSFLVLVEWRQRNILCIFAVLASEFRDSKRGCGAIVCRCFAPHSRLQASILCWIFQRRIAAEIVSTVCCGFVSL